MHWDGDCNVVYTCGISNRWVALDRHNLLNDLVIHVFCGCLTMVALTDRSTDILNIYSVTYFGSMYVLVCLW